MPIRRTLLPVLLALCAWTLALAVPAAAQNPFETVIRVNDSIVTRFEVVQRTRFLEILRAPDASQAAAREALIDDRLKRDAAREAGIAPTQEDIQFGVEDFAARANLTGEEFLFALGDVGVEPETARDFVAVQLAWGELLRERFTARARPSEAEIDRALAVGTGRGDARVLVSEIVLPLTPELAEVSRERATAISQIDNFETFAAAARRFSVAPSRTEGGRLGWRSLSSLPPQVANRFLALQPGDVTDPVVIEGGIAIYQLRALEDTRPSASRNATLDYAVFRLAPGEPAAEVMGRINAFTDTCDDLYTLFPEAGPAQLSREEANRSTMGGSLAGVLDRLDPGEATILSAEAAGGQPAIVMLCARSVIREEDLSREEVAQQLFVRRLEAFGDSYLAQLRADAFIEVVVE